MSVSFVVWKILFFTNVTFELFFTTIARVLIVQMFHFQVVGCLCPKGFSGMFCGRAADVCRGKPCFRGVQCQPASDSSQFTCGECPDHTITEGKEGYKCFEHGL